MKKAAFEPPFLLHEIYSTQEQRVPTLNVAALSQRQSDKTADQETRKQKPRTKPVANVRLGCSQLFDQLQGLVENLQHLPQLMSTLQDRAINVDNAVSTLLGRQLGVLFNAVKRHLT